VAKEYSGGGDPKRSIELLWGINERSKRGPKPKLSLAQITQAAIGIADTEGLDALSMRRVGDELGVTAMSLYSYVPGKAELLDLMLDAVYGESTAPAGPDWRRRLEHVARDNWALYLRHPWLLQIATARPVLGPNTIAKYDHELRAVEGIGLGDVEMDLVITAVANYVHGAVRAAIEAAQTEQESGKTDLQWWEEHAPLLQKVFDTTRYPVATRVGAAAGEAYNAPSDPARSFEFGLQRLLGGIEAFVRSATA
jgi:AcrR family transcriptional regulator